VSLDAVHADAENGRLDRFERFDFVTEIDGFERSARGGVLGVKVENDLSPGEVPERDFLAVIRDKRERRRFAPRFDHLVLLFFDGPPRPIGRCHGAVTTDGSDAV
jgi:hypothetical protein